jgi:uncharacterized protein YeaO (DUF488 family)
LAKLKIKRVYVQAEQTDGLRVLVDRLWPRGVKKTEARIDLWLKDIAPTPELRKWFDHKPEKWTDFYREYHKQLDLNSQNVHIILEALQKGDVTLLYAAKDEKINHALALKEYIDQKHQRVMKT